MRTGVVVLGSTGSIGRQALDVIRHHSDRLEVVGLAAGGHQVELLAQQVHTFRPRAVALADGKAAALLRGWIGDEVPVLIGQQGLVELACWPEAAITLVAVVGAAGLHPTLAALAAGKRVALANKETLVVGGHLVMAAAQASSPASLLPVDGEHSAIWQCLEGRDLGAAVRVYLTASGGPFLRASREAMASAAPEVALQHPTWSMGPRISIDSATLMNKGFEVIEARWLFDLTWDQIRVLIHPQSLVHGLVELADGSLLAHLGPRDMRLPIQYALLYPERRPAPVSPLDLTTVGRLEFEPPDFRRFPCLKYAYEAGQAGGTAPAVLNAADEVAVSWFLAGRIGFLDIPAIIREVLDQHEPQPSPSLEEVLTADAWAREAARAAASRRAR